MFGLLAACALPASARADVELDPATDTVRVAGRLDGTLSGPAAGAAAPIGLRYVREHRAELGLSAADLDTLSDPKVKSAGGIRQVRWRQQVDGIEVADAELRVNVDADGRVINVLGSPSSSLPEDTTPRLAKPEPDAELTIYSDRLAYRYTDEAAPDAIYDTITDADTGKVLKRTNLVKSITAKVWDNHPSDQPARTVVLDPWLSETTRLEGPWVHAYVDVNGTNTATSVTPGEYPFVSDWPAGIGCTPAKPCSWNGTNATRATNRNQNAVQAFYLANRFRDHLAAAPIGFDDFSGVDKVRVETSNGNNFVNNANMYTPPEGQPPRMQMYFWSGQGYRSVNSGDDASILFHEYTHGLSGRLVIDADGVQALGSWQSGAMGEGWSDFYAKDYLVQEGLETDTPAAGEIDMGAYMDATAHSTRNAGLDCPVGSTCPGGGYTYDDFAEIAGGPEVHADGEIWAQTLWDLRTAMANPDATLAVVTQAMRLSPPEPSFVDMRNAILQADEALFDGQYRTTIWTVFAGRGMGFYASTTGGADTSPVANTALPPGAGTPRGTISGRITDADDGSPLAGVAVSVGGLWEEDPNALVKTTGADGRFTITGVPAQNDLTLVVRGTSNAQLATGYEQELIPGIDVVADTTSTADAELRRNWASVRAGATLQSTGGSENADGGCGPKQAIDGLTGSTWSTAARSPLVVKLPRAVNLSAIGIDPTEGCADDARAALAGYTVEVSADGVGWQTVRVGTFADGDRLHMNEFATAVAGVRYARLTPTSNQGGSGWTDVTEFVIYGRPQMETEILSGPSAPDSSATFTFFAETAARYECRVDAGAWEACTSPETVTGLASGTYTFFARAFNAAGEPDPTPAQRAFTINAALPETTILTRPPAVTRETAPTFTFGGGDSYECTWNGVSGPCARSFADGTYTLSVAAGNGAGLDPSPATYTFSVDTTPPQVALSNATVSGTSVTFTFAATDASAVSYTCQFGDTTVPCGSPRTYSGLSDGEYMFSVIATDAAGNSASAARAFVIDATPPETMITWGPPPILITRDFALAFTASEAASFVCSVDGAAATPCSSPLQLVGLSEGAHSVVVTAIDATGQADPTPARSDFTVIIPGLPPAPSPTPTPTATVPAKRAALTSATVPKTVSRTAGKVRVTVRGVKGAKVAVEAKLGSRVVGKTTKTLRGSSLSFQLVLDKRRLKPGARVTVRVQATGSA